MPIPFILGGLAIAAGIAGVKKGFDAKGGFDSASHISDCAKSKYDRRIGAFEQVEKTVKIYTEEYGAFKVRTYRELLEIEFLSIYNRLVHGNTELKEFLPEVELDKIKVNIDTAKEISSGAIKAISGGVGVGISVGVGAAAGAWALAGSIGVASTGTAISSLPGVVATNAAMAWLGGGALSAGGFGMSGGAALLGGLVAGPAIAVTGFVMASKAEEAYTKACEYRDNVDIACVEMDNAESKLDALKKRIGEFQEIATELANQLELKVDQLRDIYYETKGFDLSDSQKNTIEMAAEYAKALNECFSIPIIDENGLNEESSDALKNARAFLSSSV